MAALASVLAVAPVFLLAIAIVWLAVRPFWHIGFWAFAGIYLLASVVLFVRGAQLLLVAPLLGARRPTADELGTFLARAAFPAMHSDKPQEAVIEVGTCSCGGRRRRRRRRRRRGRGRRKGGGRSLIICVCLEVPS